MVKKIIAISGIIGFTFVGQHLYWIEDLFGLEYPFGECVTSWLLAILICILIYGGKK